jgi:hypothetical protein
MRRADLPQIRLSTSSRAQSVMTGGGTAQRSESRAQMKMLKCDVVKPDLIMLWVRLRGLTKMDLMQSPLVASEMSVDESARVWLQCIWVECRPETFSDCSRCKVFRMYIAHQAIEP